MDLPDIRDVDVKGKRVLVRADLNVPLDDGQITDDSRITAAMATFRHVVDHGGRLIVISHLGRPGGKPEPRYSLRPVAERIDEMMSGISVAFAEDCVGESAQQAVGRLGDGAVVVLENLRFHAGEKDNDPTFAEALARHGDVYVNDAFSAAHRAHASIVGVAEHLPSAAGRLMMQELDSLERLLEKPDQPYLVLLGGAKAETKVPVIEQLLGRADRILLGGVMATAFLKAQGREVGRSKVDDAHVEMAKRLSGDARQSKTEILLPVDVMVAAEKSGQAAPRLVDVQAIPPDVMILDIGPETIRRFRAAIGEEGTVVWNGTLGVAELAPFRNGTQTLATLLAGNSQNGRQAVVVGGGDTVAFLKQQDLFDKFTYVSMAGGAFLDWLAGKPLPGVEALKDAAQAGAV